MPLKIVRSFKDLPLQDSDRDIVRPVLPLMTSIIFPGETHTIQIGRQENLAVIEAAQTGDHEIVLSFASHAPKSGDDINLSEVGVVVRIQATKSAVADSQMVTLECLRRVALIDVISEDPYAAVSIAEVKEQTNSTEELQQTAATVMRLVHDLIRLDDRYSSELGYTLSIQSEPGRLADRVASLIHFHLVDKQQILEAVNIEQRLQILNDLLRDQIENASTSVRINNRVRETMERQKREMYLRQQLLEIRRELGEDFVELDVAQQYQNQVKDRKDLPEEVRKQVILEADRLKQLSSSSAEYGLTKRYIDLLLALPWGEPEHRRLDMKKVEKAIGEHYYGSTKIKDQVLEFLSVRQLSRDPNDLSILCLSGATGTGKASLAKALSHACGWPLVRINGSSLITVEDIKGTLRSDIGAGPGQLIRTFQREGTRDLIIFIEDIEYIIESQDGNALLALMEAVDPRQNQHFLDNYAGIPIDISRVFFIIGVTNLDDIPEPFAHRLEFVELQGYIEREKITIAKRYILPKLYVKHGLTRTELSFNDKALSRIIRFYTMESGLIAFRQQLEKIFRKVARRKAAFEECKHKITDSTVESFLGSPLFIPEKMVAQPEVGVATGLAWTGAGGDLMLIEGLKMRGQGQVIYTGSLGEVMKESIQAAHSYVRAKAEMLGIDHNDFMNFDVHIHFPQGSIPKDGPSAGVAVTLVIASVFAERPIRNDIAMTGEVTLRGKVLPVGGIKEKASAAYRAGIHTIIIPKENEKDLKSLPKEILRKTQFVLIDSVDQLFEEGLIDFTPSTYTLEKLFAEEIEKAKKRSRTKTKAAKKSPATRKRKKPVGKSKKKGS